MVVSENSLLFEWKTSYNFVKYLIKDFGKTPMYRIIQNYYLLFSQPVSHHRRDLINNYASFNVVENKFEYQNQDRQVLRIS